MPNDEIRMSKECAMSNDSKKKLVRPDSQSYPFHHEHGAQHILADDRLESSGRIRVHRKGGHPSPRPSPHRGARVVARGRAFRDYGQSGQYRNVSESSSTAEIVSSFYRGSGNFAALTR